MDSVIRRQFVFISQFLVDYEQCFIVKNVVYKVSLRVRAMCAHSLRRLPLAVAPAPLSYAMEARGATPIILWTFWFNVFTSKLASSMPSCFANPRNDANPSKTAVQIEAPSAIQPMVGNAIRPPDKVPSSECAKLLRHGRRSM
mmetsp:Transcript_4582/g.29039  ORF Transcript_4582/g.29039 Transcript_4582/m.29039 type:complete len:143 (-) Transcript_4582:1657-2085(-)